MASDMPAHRSPAEPPGPDHDGSYAQGATTIVDHTRAAEADGYGTQFVARAEGLVHCGACDQLVNPAALHIDAVQRIEGASDAADLSLFARCRCPRCGARGVLLVGYGPNADADAAAVLPHLDLTAADAGPEAAS